MEIESQVSTDCIPQENVSLESELCPNSKSPVSRPEDSSLPSASQGHDCSQNLGKKQTRQWAAWTRQEEESFFVALRQVGKNFEKITCRVQSKNKDQVRHYYYRLVRRMNKLLGPELSLDPKNSRDTNAAMLRWWSLLEKYSCKASKLHLKPRRFKIFVETLENQLLRDRKKSMKRRVSTGENHSSFHNAPSLDPIRAIDHDIHAVKILLVDAQNIQKVGSGKGAVFKRPANVGTGQANYKLETAGVKASNHRRKTAAYKKWEKAAIAGVSMVADAAEHLERVDTDKETDNFGETLAIDDPQHGRASSSPPHSILKVSSIHNPSKLKLQLFPVDESTRRVQEMENRNPHLELTLSTRKKISSVLDHLNHKWKNSSSSFQELVLFPFWAQGENLMGYQKWTKDSPLCAADVYYLIGSPPVFRLRYGWFSRDEIVSVPSHSLSHTKTSEKNLGSSTAMEQNAASVIPVDSSYNCGPPVSELRSIDATRVELAEANDNVDVLVENTGLELSAGEWADSLTKVTMGDLLLESAPNMDIEFPSYQIPPVSNSILQMPFSCDSFDAAIAAHIYKHRSRSGEDVSHVPAIWEAEDTCDGFGFHKEKASSNSSILGVSRLVTPEIPSSTYDKEIEELTEVDKVTDKGDESSSDHQQIGETSKDICGISDMYWPESLGALDLEIPSCRYSSDLILSDSLTGFNFNRLLANSVDAFQVPADSSSSLFSDFKIGSEV